MTTRPRHTRARSGCNSAPALVAVTTTAAGAATAQTLAIAGGSGPIVGSVCTGYDGLDLGVLVALDGGRVAWCADPDLHFATIHAALMPGMSGSEAA